MVEDRFLKRLRKKARKGLRGWPIATIAFYGPNLHQATKTAVGIVPSENAEVEELRAWIVDRGDSGIACEILEFIEEHQVKSIAIGDGIIGCPHQQGIDYEASGVRFASFGTDAIGLQDNGALNFVAGRRRPRGPVASEPLESTRPSSGSPWLNAAFCAGLQPFP
jgi:hypothetical protein